MLSRADQAWYTFGTVVQLVFALGLHRKMSIDGKPGNDMYIVNECRKRTFWTVYTVDRYLSVLLGRPRLLQDEDIDAPYPDRVNDEDMTSTGIRARANEDDCLEDAAFFHARYEG